jgi:long-chain acyl-CoA synthetase
MRLTVCALLVALAAANSVVAAEVAGVKIPDVAMVGGKTLLLNGAGKRVKIIFDVYVGALYLSERSRDGAAVLGSTAPKRMSLTLLRNLSAEQLSDALQEGIRLNAGAAELERIKAPVATLVATMQAIGKADKGNVLTIDFLPDGGTQVALNGEPKGKPIAGAEFQRALLKVWLGAKPVQADLKESLLGG